MKLKTGDKVVVVSGSNKGKEGKITKILDSRVIVEGVNIVKKHLKPKNNNGNGEIIETEAAIHVSNVMLVDPKTKKPTKVKIEKDSKGNNKTSGSFVTGDVVVIGNSKEEESFGIVIYGDVNGDGKIDKDDCLGILRHLKGYGDLKSYYAMAADNNKDGKIDKDDCLGILRHLKGYTNLNK